MTGGVARQITFRPVVLEDFPRLCRWLAEPHVRAFYQRTPISLEEVAEKHGPRVRGEVPTICHIALYGDTRWAFVRFGSSPKKDAGCGS